MSYLRKNNHALVLLLFSSRPWGFFALFSLAYSVWCKGFRSDCKLVFRLKPALGPGGNTWSTERPPASTSSQQQVREDEPVQKVLQSSCDWAGSCKEVAVTLRGLRGRGIQGRFGDDVCNASHEPRSTSWFPSHLIKFLTIGKSWGLFLPPVSPSFSF